MPDRMVREAARFSARLEAVSKDAELMFWRLITVPDDFGIYYADPAQLRAAIWPMNTRNIRTSDVARWRDELTRAGVLAEFDVEGIRYIELQRFGQAEKLRTPRRRYPARPQVPDDPAQLKMQLVADPPPPGREQKRREEKGGGSAGARRPAPRPPMNLRETDEQWLARLETEWPHVDVRTELEKAVKKRGAQGVEREWFRRHWLPGCSETVAAPRGTQAAGRGGIEPEPEAWRVWLENAYPGNAYGKGGAFETTDWHELPADVRSKIAREMAAERGRAA